MQKFVRVLLEEMKVSLEQVSNSSENNLRQSASSCQVVQQALHQLKDHVLNEGFKSEADEIIFFKEIKPVFLSELIFYSELYQVEANQPMGSTESVLNYFEKNLDGLDDYFTKNRSLFTYVKTGQTINDEIFFLRNADKDSVLLNPEYSLDIDPEFSTPYSSALAKLLAYERLEEHIRHLYYEYKNPDYFMATASVQKAGVWTDSKTALIELAYAMHARGSINHGKGDIRTIITKLEAAFGVKVGNFYRAFQNMRIRKKNRTVYLDALKEHLERHMDESDLDF